MKKNHIEIFTPPAFKPVKFEMSYINSLTINNTLYASKGRYALMHILNSLSEIDSILLPAYLCESVLNTVVQLGIKHYFYDLDPEDLNASLDSIKFIIDNTEAKAVFVASMYGNPANLIEIEQFCKSKNIFLIDDAAQSFGAELNGKPVGFFGDAGFFSFSPGKPTAGHMGSFFWTQNKSYKIAYKHHKIVHKVAYWDFYFNRLNIYKYKRYHVFVILKSLNILLCKIYNLSNDTYEEFETKILGGILKSMKDGNFNFRQRFFDEFAEYFKANSLFNVVRAKRGKPNNHKIIIRCINTLVASDMVYYCKKNNVYASKGYNLLTNNYEFLPNSREIDGCIVEFPIENNENRMNYLIKTVKEFIYSYSK